VRRETGQFRQRLESDVVDKLDEVWRKRGMHSRTEFLRDAMRTFASSVGEPELAALLGSAPAGGES
jgi:hypothetical protein